MKIFNGYVSCGWVLSGFFRVKILTEAISPGSFSWSRDTHNASLLCKLSDA